MVHNFPDTVVAHSLADSHSSLSNDLLVRPDHFIVADSAVVVRLVTLLRSSGDGRHGSNALVLAELACWQACFEL